MNSTTEYMTEKGLEKLQTKLTEAEENLAKLQLQRKDVIGTDGDGPHDNAAFEQLELQERILYRTISDLRQKIVNAEIIKPPDESVDYVQIGSTVTIKFTGDLDDDLTETYTILGSADSDPARGIISDQSPLGAALIRKCVGDLATYRIGTRDIGVIVIAIETHEID